MFVDGLGDRPNTGDVVIVTHGGTIRALRAYCAGEPMLGDALGRGAQRQRVEDRTAGHCPGNETITKSTEAPMRPTTLQLPERPAKPRSTGITMVVDGGLPTRYFRDVVESGAEFLDFVKFGWGTALVTNDLSEKIAVLREVGVNFYFGGTLFEKFVLQDRLDDFRDLCQTFSCEYVEVSNGTIDLTNPEKAGLHQEAVR